MGVLGWVWLSLILATTYGAVMVSLLLYRSGNRVAKAVQKSNLIFHQLQNLPEPVISKKNPNTQDQLTGLVKSRNKEKRMRRSEKAARRQALIARLNTMMSEQAGRKK